MTGARAVTSPPGLLRQVVAPSAADTRSTGSRLATTTKLLVPVGDKWGLLVPTTVTELCCMVVTALAYDGGYGLPRARDPRLRAPLVEVPRRQGTSRARPVRPLGHALLPTAERPDRSARGAGARSPAGTAAATAAGAAIGHRLPADRRRRWGRRWPA